MGKIVSAKKYDYYEYIVAVLISLGMCAFLFGKAEDSHPEQSTTFAGAIILFGVDNNVKTYPGFEFIEMLAKWYIYRCRIENQLSIVKVFLKHLKCRL